MNEATCTSTPSRADAQRDRILCAALKCFIEHGFDAASMANIAETAQMSAGLMYRYFENKNAIVLGIIERQLQEKRAGIRALQNSTDLVTGLLEAFERWCSRDSKVMNAALFLEMSAESTRNPQIAEALRVSDAQTLADFQAWLERSRDEGGLGFPAEKAAARALAIRCFVDGLLLRSVRDPDLDRERLRTAVQDYVAALTS